MKQFKKFYDQNGQEYKHYVPNKLKYNHKSREDLAIHYRNVINFYSSALDYIKTLPSFHIGYDLATNLLLTYAKKYGLDSCGSMIEIGCGLGNTMLHLAQTNNLQIVGIDINPDQIKECRKKIHNNNLSDRLRVECLNIYDYKGPKTDSIFSEDSFSHIPNKNKLIKKLYAMLNPGGLLIFSDLVRSSSIKDDEHLNQVESWSLWPIETTKSYQKLLKKNGFKILEYHDNIGRDLSLYHIQYNRKSQDSSVKEYEFFLKKNEQFLKTKWMDKKYQLRLERLMVFNLLKQQKLDYVFFVTKKCNHIG